MTDCLHNFLGESACEHCGMTETTYAASWAQEEYEKGKTEGAAEMQAKIVAWLNEWAIGRSWGYSRPCPESTLARTFAGLFARGEHLS